LLKQRNGLRLSFLPLAASIAMATSLFASLMAAGGIMAEDQEAFNRFKSDRMTF